jgi:dTDP-4-dehydrorhamnose reductase
VTILVVGRSGQLGQSLLTALPRQYPGAVFWDRQALDLVQQETIAKSLAGLKPQIIINASAYTAVDMAEQETELAYAINRDAVNELAGYCARNDAALIHVSTDYVFDGAADAPY